MTLEIHCLDHFMATQRFAASLGGSALQSFHETLDYLTSYCDEQLTGATRCLLGKDRAPYSFSFTMQQRRPDGSYECWFPGGMLFYNAGDSGVGAPQYSVRLDCSRTGWQIHT